LIDKTNQFRSFKKTVNGVVENYILVDDVEVFTKWVTATELCKKLNLLNKNDRIAVFNVVVNGEKMF
jgi:hypothetical protein